MEKKDKFKPGDLCLFDEIFVLIIDENRSLNRKNDNLYIVYECLFPDGSIELVSSTWLELAKTKPIK